MDHSTFWWFYFSVCGFVFVFCLLISIRKFVKCLFLLPFLGTRGRGRSIFFFEIGPWDGWNGILQMAISLFFLFTSFVAKMCTGVHWTFLSLNFFARLHFFYFFRVVDINFSMDIFLLKILIRHVTLWMLVLISFALGNFFSFFLGAMFVCEMLNLVEAKVSFQKVN